MQEYLHLASRFVTIFASRSLGKYGAKPLPQSTQRYTCTVTLFAVRAEANSAPVHTKIAKEPDAGTHPSLCVKSSRLMSTTPAAACPLLRCLAVLSEELWRENLALAARERGRGKKAEALQRDY